MGEIVRDIIIAIAAFAGIGLVTMVLLVLGANKIEKMHEDSEEERKRALHE